MIDVDDSIKKKSRWVDDHIATLDPKKDYAEIMGLISQYQFDEFVLHFLITGTNINVIMPAHGAEAQVFTNKAVRRPAKRMQDTLGIFWTWYAYGPKSPEAIEATKMLNDIHMGVAKHVPGHFSLDSDFIFTMCQIMVSQHRLFKKLGLGGAPAHVNQAHYYFWKELSKHFVKEDGKGGTMPLEDDFPNSFEESLAYVNDWESWDHRYSPVQTDIVSALIYAFGARWFPKSLQPLGRWLITHTIQDHVLEHYRIKPLTGIPRFIAHNLLKGIFWFKGNYAPDSKVSFIKKRTLLTKEEYTKRDSAFTKLADQMGWHRGGKSAVGIKERKANGDISMCPVHQILPKKRIPSTKVAEMME